ncbi:hypothetical protein B566_EDAN002074 [Ephemera danica]|nr:hypothetical protein B566_EDAN002074 [Ephemera danica]
MQDLHEEITKLKQNRSTTFTGQSTFPISHLDTVELGGRKYFFSTKQHMTWIDAVTFCRLYGMELTSVETKAEDELIAGHLKSIGQGGSIVYISGNKIGRSSYTWLNGEPLRYENWHTGNPAQFSTEHCIVYYQSSWADFHCHSDPKPFICEEQ